MEVLPWPLSVLVPRPRAFADFYCLGPERDRFWDDAIQRHRETLTPGSPRDWIDEARRLEVRMGNNHLDPSS